MIPAAGSSAQAAAKVVDTPARYAEDIQATANGTADPALVEAYTRQSAGVLDWLSRHYGIRFGLVEGLAPGHSARRMNALAHFADDATLDEIEQNVAHRAARLYRFDEEKYRRLKRKGFNFEI